jgi:gamma-glutamyl-gamma-aminobutyrate hydrolase PuuD
LIGITSYARGGTRLSFSVPCEYVDAIRRAGGVPVVLPPVLGPVREARRGVRPHLPRQRDVHPEHYGGDDHDANYGTCHERDAFELVMARAALEARHADHVRLPGMQVLNVALGGDLIPHIPDVFGTRVSIVRPVQSDRALGASRGSHLARIYGGTAATVQSVHHQAVGRLGDGLRAVAWADDGVVEASSRSTIASSSPCSGTPSWTSSRTSRRTRCSTRWSCEAEPMARLAMPSRVATARESDQNCQATGTRGSGEYEQKYPVRTAATRCCPSAGLRPTIFFTTAPTVRLTLTRVRSATEAAVRLRRGRRRGRAAAQEVDLLSARAARSKSLNRRASSSASGGLERRLRRTGRLVEQRQHRLRRSPAVGRTRHACKVNDVELATWMPEKFWSSASLFVSFN